ncbi:hypothetical protein CVT26_013125 [Gymnopilus dilepis]|uniref:Cytochrome P450 n=1 Tax=Gymnopilus dilepis TaxID=231916 RepID=A0A409YF46_9AGAR|nr:hypothetical protein CVT26_013125 [Gymnopilus dilepis]
MYQNDSLSVAVVAILFPSIYLISRAILGSSTYRLRHIPTVGGSSGLISSYFTSFRFYFHGHVLIQEGYEKYPSSVFKIASMSRWIVGRFVAIKVSRVVKLVERHIRPLAEDRIEQIMQGNKPNGTESSTLLTWLVDETLKSQRLLDFDDLSRRVLDTSFVAVGTMLSTFPDVLINLAAYPKYVSPMREEVLAVTTKEGWTKSAVGKMHKVDSFIKETLRIGIGSSTGNRKIFKDFTLSNGVTLPAGTFVSFPTCAIHLDEQHYHNSHEFQGFRFAEMTVGERPDTTGTNQLVTLAPEFLAFGIGRHACPGRFFASYTLKVALAHVLLNFDVDFLDSSNTQVMKFWFQALSIPYSTPELILRKRV